MSVFDTAFANGPADALASVFGESITYTPAGESGQTITAIVDRDAYEIEPLADGRGVMKRARLSVSAADITPAVNDGVTLDSLAWTVESIEGPEGGMYDLVIARWAASARSHGDDRTERS